MQYNASNPKEYFNLLEEDWRKEKLLEVRTMIRTCNPKLKEGIEYKMLSYSNDKSSIFHLNAQKNFVGLYVGNIDKIANADELLEGFNRGKGCIRIRKSNQLSDTNLLQFIETVIDIYRKGENIDC